MDNTIFCNDDLIVALVNISNDKSFMYRLKESDTDFINSSLNNKWCRPTNNWLKVFGKILRNYFEYVKAYETE